MVGALSTLTDSTANELHRIVQRQAKTVATVLMNATSAPEPADFAIELDRHLLDQDPATRGRRFAFGG